MCQAFQHRGAKASRFQPGHGIRHQGLAALPGGVHPQQRNVGAFEQRRVDSGRFPQGFRRPGCVQYVVGDLKGQAQLIPCRGECLDGRVATPGGNAAMAKAADMSAPVLAR